MNGNQMEQVFQLIDRNLQRSSEEAAAYIRAHQGVIAESLARTGSAMVRTSAGDVCLSLKDLEASAA